MKTKIMLEIETPDKIDVFPEEGQTEEDWKGKEKELQEHREQYVKDLHIGVVEKAAEYFEDGIFEEDTIDNFEELYIEGWDSFVDYGIKIDLTEVK